MPGAIAAIGAASTSTTLDAAEQTDLQAAAATLRRRDINYTYGVIPNQPTAGAAARMENGRATITINLNSPTLFNADGTVNMTTFSSFLVHEARHISDARFYGQRNGPSTIAHVRRTERNAYRTEAAFLKATGGVMGMTDLSGATVPLTRANANVAAEGSVRSWVGAAAISARQTNAAIDRSYADYRRRVTAFDRANGTRTTLSPRQPHVPIPVYRPPSSY
jgi:hypothetical protein